MSWYRATPWLSKLLCALGLGWTAWGFWWLWLLRGVR